MPPVSLEIPSPVSMRSEPVSSDSRLRVLNIVHILSMNF